MRREPNTLTPLSPPRPRWRASLAEAWQLLFENWRIRRRERRNARESRANPRPYGCEVKDRAKLQS